MTVCKSPQSNFLETLLNCHWPVNDSCPRDPQKCHWLVKDILWKSTIQVFGDTSKMSLTVRWQLSRKVSFTGQWYSLKVLSSSPQSIFLETLQNCHWPGWRFKQGKREKFLTIASTFFSAIIVSQYPTFPLQLLSFLDALASLDFKLSVCESRFSASASTGLSELFS